MQSQISRELRAALVQSTAELIRSVIGTNRSYSNVDLAARRLRAAQHLWTFLRTAHTLHHVEQALLGARRTLTHPLDAPALQRIQQVVSSQFKVDML